MNAPTPMTARSAVAALLLAAAVPVGLWAASRPLLAAGVLATLLGAVLLGRTAAARLGRSGGWHGRLGLPVLELSLELAVTRRGR
jgi:hypothetical protein